MKRILKMCTLTGLGSAFEKHFSVFIISKQSSWLQKSHFYIILQYYSIDLPMYYCSIIAGVAKMMPIYRVFPTKLFQNLTRGPQKFFEGPQFGHPCFIFWMMSIWIFHWFQARKPQRRIVRFLWRPLTPPSSTASSSPSSRCPSRSAGRRIKIYRSWVSQQMTSQLLFQIDSQGRIIHMKV